MSNPYDLVGTKEVANALGMSRTHLTRLLADGRAPLDPVVTIPGRGGTFLFRREDMAAAVEKGGAK